MAKQAQPPSSLLIDLFWNERKLLIATAIALFAVYAFALREPYTRASCHLQAEQHAKVRMQQRAAQTPDNQQFMQAAKSGLYVVEDYTPRFRNCMMLKGYKAE